MWKFSQVLQRKRSTERMIHKEQQKMFIYPTGNMFIGILFIFNIRLTELSCFNNVCNFYTMPMIFNKKIIFVFIIVQHFLRLFNVLWIFLLYRFPWQRDAAVQCCMDNEGTNENHISIRIPSQVSYIYIYIYISRQNYLMILL